jgi:hypothetical protein
MTNPRGVEAKPCPWTLAQPNRAKIIGVVVYEIATHAEAARDLGGINQLGILLPFLKQSGYPQRNCLNVRLAQAHLCSMSKVSGASVGFL